MCRNYDAGECVEDGCTGRITCHDFWDRRCTDHAVNGRNNLFIEDEEDNLTEVELVPVTEAEWRHEVNF